jgi:flagellar hook-associated protein 3 FlgL
MRISFAIAHQGAIREINRKQVDIDRLTTMISSEKKLLSPSDDPDAWAAAMDLKQGLRAIETFENNIQFGLSWGEMTDLYLDRLSELIMEATDIANSAITGGTDEEHAANVTLSKQIVEDALEIANAEYNGRYLFSGLADPSSTTGVYWLDSGGTAHYEGDQGELKVRTGTNKTSIVNLNGEDVFTYPADTQTYNILEELWSLREAIAAEDTTAIQSALTNLDGALEHVQSQRSVLAVRLSDMKSQQEALDALSLSKANRLSELEAADTAEMIILLQQKQTALEACLSTTAMIDDLNLMDFL